MSISKEQWKVIEDHLKRMWVEMKFSLNGHEILITRTRKSESTTALVVYIDTLIKSEWMSELDKIDPADDFMNGVVKRVWFHKSKGVYSRKELASLEKYKKRVGVRYFKKMFPVEPKAQVFTWLTPSFGSSAALVRQFKKIEGLSLITPLGE